MSDAVWRPVLDELDRLAEAGRSVALWLRDDDAVSDTPALRRLADLGERFGLPVLLAVIPAPAEDGLAAFVAAHPILTPTQHGYAHANHAPAGERARELGGRALAATLDDLRHGRERLAALFGPRMADILVPPWNRIDADVVAALPGLGFGALSAFAPAGQVPPGLAALPCDLDIIDWRNGRVLRPPAVLADRLAGLIAEAGERPVGLLTHHLVHGDDAWEALADLFESIAGHPAVRFRSAQALLDDLEPGAPRRG